MTPERRSQQKMDGKLWVELMCIGRFPEPTFTVPSGRTYELKGRRSQFWALAEDVGSMVKRGIAREIPKRVGGRLRK